MADIDLEIRELDEATSLVDADVFVVQTDVDVTQVTKKITKANLKSTLGIAADIATHAALQTGVHGLAIAAGKTLTATDDATVSGTNTGDQTLPVKASGLELTAGVDDAKFATAKALADAGFVLDTDTALTANSDLKIPTQKAIKAYVDGKGTPTALTANSVTAQTSHDLALIPDTANSKVVTTAIRRQGGSPTDWSVGGTTNYTESGVFIQVGADSMSGWTAAGNTKTITFPVAFSQPPLVFTNFFDTNANNYGAIFNVRQITTTDALLVNNAPVDAGDVCFWIAIGKR